jgi:hypothetical protein
MPRTAKHVLSARAAALCLATRNGIKHGAAALAVLSALQSRAIAAEPATLAPAPSDIAASRLVLDAPILDVRTNLLHRAWPSMQQSLMATKDTYYLVHAALLGGLAALHQPGTPRWATGLMTVTIPMLADIVLVSLPLGDGWLHEEWHRAVLSRRGIHSYNAIYDLQIGQDAPVSHVRDEDLIALKRAHPAEMVRLSEAGLEAQLEFILELDKDRFYRGTRAGTVITEWLDTINVSYYLLEAAYRSEGITREARQEEDQNISARGATGLDPVAWVYDLHRPDEPYEARGVHPSGVGIDRYRSESNLTRQEQLYLRKQAWLSLINLLNPNLFGLYGFEWGNLDPLRFNVTVQHHLTPFGYALSLNAFASRGKYQWFSQLQMQFSNQLLLPGVSAELVRCPLPVSGMSLSPAVRLWLQPEDQRFYAKRAALGGQAGFRLNAPVASPIEWYVEVSAKTAGWVAGNVFLDESIDALIGLEAVVF